MLRVYTQSHRRHRTGHRLCVFNAGGATVRRCRGRIICTMLKCPPRKVGALRACRSAGSLIVIVRREAVTSEPRSHPPVLGAPPGRDGSLWTVSVAPCSPCQGQTLTRLRAALVGPGPQPTRSRS
jgi:hypothetical protein